MLPRVPTHDEVLAASADHHEQQQRRAAATVRRQVTDADGQALILECLGLADLDGKEPALSR